MSDDPQKPVAALTTTPDENLEAQRAALMKRAQFLNVQYAVLFAASLLLLVYNWSGGRTPLTTILWAATLGAAVVTRIYRSSIVNRVNRGPLV